MTNEAPRLRRSRNAVVAGVCGGLADWLGWPANRVRVIYVIVSILSAAFPGTLVYLVLWFLMPGPEAMARAEPPAAPPRAAPAGGTRTQAAAAGPAPAAGDRTAPPAPAKVHRNDPCPCGSGEKYKRCCGIA